MKRLFRALRIAAKDTRIPRWVRAVAAFGVAPIPGPLDEAVLLIIAPVLALFYRAELRQAWQQADNAG